tara:strand:+ start:2666 stop:3019 length:354 start_codon:yes stop_codon:yes gene_type:complete
MKISKKRIRTIVLEQVAKLQEANKANPEMVKSVNDAIDNAPNLAQALDRVQDAATGSAVITHFINKLSAKGIDKSKLINMMTQQFQAAKDADSSQVGKSTAAKTTAAAAPAAPKTAK